MRINLVDALEASRDGDELLERVLNSPSLFPPKPTSPSHPPGVASPSHGRPTSHHLSPCTPPHTCYTLPRDEMRALMKVASFIIATLLPD